MIDHQRRLDTSGKMTHQRFIPGARIQGIANQKAALQ